MLVGSFILFAGRVVKFQQPTGPVAGEWCLLGKTFHRRILESSRDIAFGGEAPGSVSVDA